MEFVLSSCLGYCILKGLAKENYIGLFKWLLWSFLRIAPKLLWNGCGEVCQVTLKASIRSLFSLRQLCFSICILHFCGPGLSTSNIEIQLGSNYIIGKILTLTTVLSFLVIPFLKNFSEKPLSPFQAAWGHCFREGRPGRTIENKLVDPSFWV